MDTMNERKQAEEIDPATMDATPYYWTKLRFKDKLYGQYGVKDTLSYMDAISVLCYHQMGLLPVVRASEYQDLQMELYHRSHPIGVFRGEEVIRFLVGHDQQLFSHMDLVSERFPDFKAHEKLLTGESYAHLVSRKTGRKYIGNPMNEKEMMEPRYFRMVRPNGYVVGEFALSAIDPLPSFTKEQLRGDFCFELLKQDGTVRSRLSIQAYSFIQNFEATGWPYYEPGAGFGSTLIARGYHEPFILSHYPEYIQFLKDQGMVEQARDLQFQDTVRKLWGTPEWSQDLMDFHWDRTASKREASAWDWLRHIEGKVVKSSIDRIDTELLREDTVKDLFPADLQAVVERVRSLVIDYPHLLAEDRIPKRILMNRSFWFPLLELSGSAYNVARYIPGPLLDDEIVQFDLVQNGYLNPQDLGERLLRTSVAPSPLRDIMRDTGDMERVLKDPGVVIDKPMLYYAMAKDYRLLTLIPEDKLWDVKGFEERLIHTLRRQVTKASLTSQLDKLPTPLRTERVNQVIEELKSSLSRPVPQGESRGEEKSWITRLGL